MAITLDEVRARVANIRSWQRGNEVAPHKPLLMLYALGRLQTGKPRLVEFEHVAGPLKELLKEFGPRRRSYHPELPFWHLQSDGLWEIVPAVLQRRKGGTSPSAKTLRGAGAKGGLPEEVYEVLKANPQATAELALKLLAASFAESIHGDILAAVGLAIYTGSTALKRDPRFRDQVLTAYGRACAVCGFHVHLGTVALAVEAAHIRWHQHGGPSLVANGLCLCSTHHKIFDLGGFTLTADLEVEIADAVDHSASAEQWLWAFDGRRLRLPKKDDLLPSEAFVSWHRKEVFKASSN